jgi:hypothetical protein
MTLTQRKSRPVVASAPVSETTEEKQRKAKGKALAAPYEPTPREKAAIDAYRAQKAGKYPSPDLKVVMAGKATSVAPDHPDSVVATKLLMKALGTTNPHFVQGLLTQLANAGSKGQEPDEHGINFMLSVVKGIEPKDELEAMLAAQMAAVHMASMTFARRLAHVDNLPQQDSAERAFNKLARTFTTQMEALKRYRTGGQQKVTVEHVTVQAGGQAIVGNVSHAPGGGSLSKNPETTP